MAFNLSELLNPAPGINTDTSEKSTGQGQYAPDAVNLPDLNLDARLPPPHSLQPAAVNTALSQPPAAAVASLAEPSVTSPELGHFHLATTQDPSQALADQSRGLPLSTLPRPVRYNISPPKTQVEGADPMPSVFTPTTQQNPAQETRQRGLSISEMMVDNTAHAEQMAGLAEEGSPADVQVPQQELAALGLAALEEEPEDATGSPLDVNAKPLPSMPKAHSTKTAARTKQGTAVKPSEGAPDKRYLCYVCHKLFTRRRSVRDHIKKIHNDSNFELSRAIEVKVDPDTGESVIPIEELVKNLPPASTGQQPRDSASRSPSRHSSPEPNTMPSPAPLAGKKRTASEMTAVGGAAKKKTVRKPKALEPKLNAVKMEHDEPIQIGDHPRSPSRTPVSTLISTTPAVSKAKKQPSKSHTSSPTPFDRMLVTLPDIVGPAKKEESASVADEEEDDEEEEEEEEEEEGDVDYGGVERNMDVDEDQGELFCICRKGDNHTWMIGCDGGCEDWFHGKCVNIREIDGNLIDKYICPNCGDRGQGQTTWKRRCRADDCRKPARVLADEPSKYCSDECARRFMVGLIQRGDPSVVVSSDGLTVLGRKGAQPSQEQGKYQRQALSDDDSDGGVRLMPYGDKYRKPILQKPAVDSNSPQLPTRGGPLTVDDMAMMLDQAPTLDIIRSLGQKPPTPPLTLDSDPLTNGASSPFPYSHSELCTLTRISTSISSLNAQLSLIRDHETFASMIKAYSARVLEEVNLPKPKTVCGYDTRLTWNLAEFASWRASPTGHKAMNAGLLGAPDSDHAGYGPDEPRGANGDGDGDVEMPDTPDSADDDDQQQRPVVTVLRGICIKTKCARHRDWKKNAAVEARFDADHVLVQVRRLEVESRSVREAAALRVLEEEESGRR